MDVEKIMELMNGDNGRSDSICAHYGIKDKIFFDEVQDIFCKLIKCDKYSDVLDELFPELSAEQRIKIYSFSCALVEYKQYKSWRVKND